MTTVHSSSSPLREQQPQQPLPLQSHPPIPRNHTRFSPLPPLPRPPPPPPSSQRPRQNGHPHLQSSPTLLTKRTLSLADPSAPEAAPFQANHSTLLETPRGRKGLVDKENLLHHPRHTVQYQRDAVGGNTIIRIRSTVSASRDQTLGGVTATTTLLDHYPSNTHQAQSQAVFTQQQLQQLQQQQLLQQQQQQLQQQQLHQLQLQQMLQPQQPSKTAIAAAAVAADQHVYHQESAEDDSEYDEDEDEEDESSIGEDSEMDDSEDDYVSSDNSSDGSASDHRPRTNHPPNPVAKTSPLPSDPMRSSSSSSSSSSRPAKGTSPNTQQQHMDTSRSNNNNKSSISISNSNNNSQNTHHAQHASREAVPQMTNIAANDSRGLVTKNSGETIHPHAPSQDHSFPTAVPTCTAPDQPFIRPSSTSPLNQRAPLSDARPVSGPVSRPTNSWKANPHPLSVSSERRIDPSTLIPRAQLPRTTLRPPIDSEGSEEDGESCEDEEEGSESYDEDEDEDEYDSTYSDEETYDEDEDEDDEEEEDDEEDEEDASQGSSGQPNDPKANVVTNNVKARTAQANYYPRTSLPPFRTARLDDKLLQRRAITKQVVRRSSLTALLGEVSTNTPEVSKNTMQQGPIAFGPQEHRRPFASVWAATTATHDAAAITPAAKVETIVNGPGTLSGTVSAIRLSPSPTSERSQSIKDQEPNRPRRTDSGVEVKLLPNLESAPTTSMTSMTTITTACSDRGGGSDSGSTSSRQVAGGGSSSNGSGGSGSGSGSSSVGVPSNPSPLHISTVIADPLPPVRRHRMRSEGDLLVSASFASASASASTGETTASAGSGSSSKCTRPPLKSSISCNTFPRSAGKRISQKHVSWHYSLFPTERFLSVKPSLPSLSTVATESVKAELSTLSKIPVMTLDNIDEFHQSLRSLRTLSRIEIAKTSYKQQGRQEIMATVPIAKSTSASLPWWSPSRWFEGNVAVDKRHWKPDMSRQTCAYCFSEFNRITNPRHHCRKCGDIFCGKCASAEILMDAKNCVYVQQSQLARWSRRVDLQRHNLWIGTLPQLHPVRTAAETALGAGSSAAAAAAGTGVGPLDGFASVGLTGSGSSRRGSWQVAAGGGGNKKTRLSIFGLFNNGGPHSTAGPNGLTGSESRRGSLDAASIEALQSNHLHQYPYTHLMPHASNGVTFSAGRRSSSSSIFRNNTVGGSSQLAISSVAGDSGSHHPLAMSRRMSSGGVGKVCLARICVGCERELLKPVPRSTSIAKHYTIGPTSGHRHHARYGYLGPGFDGARPGSRTFHTYAQAPHPMDDSGSGVTEHYPHPNHNNTLYNNNNNYPQQRHDPYAGGEGPCFGGENGAQNGYSGCGGGSGSGGDLRADEIGQGCPS